MAHTAAHDEELNQNGEHERHGITETMLIAMLNEMASPTISNCEDLLSKGDCSYGSVHEYRYEAIARLEELIERLMEWYGECEEVFIAGEIAPALSKKFNALLAKLKTSTTTTNSLPNSSPFPTHSPHSRLASMSSPAQLPGRSLEAEIAYFFSQRGAALHPSSILTSAASPIANCAIRVPATATFTSVVFLITVAKALLMMGGACVAAQETLRGYKLAEHAMVLMEHIHLWGEGLPKSKIRGVLDSARRQYVTAGDGAPIVFRGLADSISGGGKEVENLNENNAASAGRGHARVASDAPNGNASQQKEQHLASYKSPYTSSTSTVSLKKLVIGPFYRSESSTKHDGREQQSVSEDDNEEKMSSGDNKNGGDCAVANDDDFAVLFLTQRPYTRVSYAGSSVLLEAYILMCMCSGRWDNAGNTMALLNSAHRLSDEVRERRESLVRGRKASTSSALKADAEVIDTIVKAKRNEEQNAQESALQQRLLEARRRRLAAGKGKKEETTVEGGGGREQGDTKKPSPNQKGGEKEREEEEEEEGGRTARQCHLITPIPPTESRSSPQRPSLFGSGLALTEEAANEEAPKASGALSNAMDSGGDLSLPEENVSSPLSSSSSLEAERQRLAREAMLAAKRAKRAAAAGGGAAAAASPTPSSPPSMSLSPPAPGPDLTTAAAVAVAAGSGAAAASLIASSKTMDNNSSPSSSPSLQIIRGSAEKEVHDQDAAAFALSLTEGDALLHSTIGFSCGGNNNNNSSSNSSGSSSNDEVILSQHVISLPFIGASAGPSVGIGGVEATDSVLVPCKVVLPPPLPRTPRTKEQVQVQVVDEKECSTAPPIPPIVVHYDALVLLYYFHFCGFDEASIMHRLEGNLLTATAQVSKSADSLTAAVYCHKSLAYQVEKRLLKSAEDVGDWVNAVVTLAEYYLTKGDLSHAEHCLLAVEEVMEASRAEVAPATANKKEHKNGNRNIEGTSADSSGKEEQVGSRGMCDRQFFLPPRSMRGAGLGAYLSPLPSTSFPNSVFSAAPRRPHTATELWPRFDTLQYHYTWAKFYHSVLMLGHSTFEALLSEHRKGRFKIEDTVISSALREAASVTSFTSSSPVGITKGSSIVSPSPLISSRPSSAVAGSRGESYASPSTPLSSPEELAAVFRPLSKVFVWVHSNAFLNPALVPEEVRSAPSAEKEAFLEKNCADFLFEGRAGHRRSASPTCRTRMQPSPPRGPNSNNGRGVLRCSDSVTGTSTAKTDENKAERDTQQQKKQDDVVVHVPHPTTLEGRTELSLEEALTGVPDELTQHGKGESKNSRSALGGGGEGKGIGIGSILWCFAERIRIPLANLSPPRTHFTFAFPRKSFTAALRASAVSAVRKGPDAVLAAAVVSDLPTLTSTLLQRANRSTLSEDLPAAVRRHESSRGVSRWGDTNTTVTPSSSSSPSSVSGSSNSSSVSQLLGEALRSVSWADHCQQRLLFHAIAARPLATVEADFEKFLHFRRMEADSWSVVYAFSDLPVVNVDVRRCENPETEQQAEGARYHLTQNENNNTKEVIATNTPYFTQLNPTVAGGREGGGRGGNLEQPKLNKLSVSLVGLPTHKDDTSLQMRVSVLEEILSTGLNPKSYRNVIRSAEYDCGASCALISANAAAMVETLRLGGSIVTQSSCLAQATGEDEKVLGGTPLQSPPSTGASPANGPTTRRTSAPPLPPLNEFFTTESLLERRETFLDKALAYYKRFVEAFQAEIREAKAAGKGANSVLETSDYPTIVVGEMRVAELLLKKGRYEEAKTRLEENVLGFIRECPSMLQAYPEIAASRAQCVELLSALDTLVLQQTEGEGDEDMKKKEKKNSPESGTSAKTSRFNVDEIA